MKRRVLACLLALIMILALLPASALATDADTATALDITEGSITVKENGSYTASGTTENTITIKSDVTCDLTISGLEITAADGPAIRVEEGATLNLTLSGTNTLRGAPSYAGISVAAGWNDEGLDPLASGHLTIDGDGILNAFGGDGAAPVGGGAGIGGDAFGDDIFEGCGADFGVIEIKGGTVNATGGGGDPASNGYGAGAGIGGGAGLYITEDGGTVGNTWVYSGIINISNGDVTAQGGDGFVGAAGIGGASQGGNCYSDCEYLDISISGGTVKATGGTDAAGIGGSANGDHGDIKISGGTITATGRGDSEPSSFGGAGIGGGDSAGGETITIGGTAIVIAKGGGAAAGIGGGNGGYSDSITIQENANVTAYGGAEYALGGAGIGSGNNVGTDTQEDRYETITLNTTGKIIAYGGAGSQAIGLGTCASSGTVNTKHNYLSVAIGENSGEIWMFNYDNDQSALLAVDAASNTVDGTKLTLADGITLYWNGDGNSAWYQLGSDSDNTTYTWSASGDTLTVSKGSATVASCGYDAQWHKATDNWATIQALPKYTVTYDANGGVGVMTDENSPYNANAAVTVLPNSFTMEGYRFTGWNTAADGSGTSYQPGDTFPIAGDTTLYAQWSIDTTIEYTVTYVFGDGYPEGDQTKTVHGGDLAEELTPTWADHVFVGWYADEAKTVLYDFSTPITQDVTIYAQWKQLTYTLHYGDGREHDGEWGYNYADGQNGYYVPANPEPLPSEVKHFSESDVNNPSYPGVNADGWYFLTWMRYAETAAADIDETRDVYIKDGDAFVKIENWQDSDQPLYQYISEGQTPDTDCGDIDYFAQWALIRIDVQVDVDIEIHVTITGFGDNGDPVMIDHNQKGVLAKNVNLATDVRGSNTEIRITASVRNPVSDAELTALTEYLNGQYSYGSNRIDYEVSVKKEITSDGKTETYILDTLEEPIEIRFAVPDQWQRGGTVYMFRAHTDANGTTVERLPDLDGNAATYTISSDKFSTYTMIYVPYPGGTIPGGTTPSHAKDPVPEMLNGDDHFAYIVGYADGTVRPEENISRAETAMIFFRLLTPDVRDRNLTSRNPFTDVQDDMWYTKAISTMAKLGILKGRTSETFDPDAPITRAEFAAICARFDDSTATGGGRLTDLSGHWARTEVERAVALGWITGYPDNTFRPDDYITRAEAMTMINRILQRIPENAGDLLPGMRRWTDNLPGAWYYLAVQEATNSHDFRNKRGGYEYWTRLTDDPDWSGYQD